MDVVNVEQVTLHDFQSTPDQPTAPRLASQKRQVPVPSWHWNAFLPISELKGASREW